MTRARFSEHARQTVHISMGAFALLLRYLTWWEAAIMSGLALFFNVHTLPRIGGVRLFRPSEIARGTPPGIILYPFSVTLLLLLFPGRLDIVAAAWGILAVGDGMATVVGTLVGGPRIPWNRHKTVAGSVALAVLGGAAGAFLAWWCRERIVPSPYFWYSLGVPFIAAVAAAAVETIPVRLDDNVSVPATAAGVMWVFSLVSEDLAAALWQSARLSLPLALGLNVAAAAAGYAARTVSLSGAVCGAVIGTAIFVFMGLEGWILLMTAFLAAAVTSRVGLRRKVRLGIAEERGGRRGAGNAIANTGVATVAALMAVLTYAHDTSSVAFVAALTAGSSDTIASEIGKAWGRSTWLLTSLRRVPPGTSGAISLEGSVAGLLGACAFAGAGVGLDLIPASAVLPVIAGATVGSLVESALGATLEAPGVLNNDLLNFINTGVAAATAVLLAGVIL